MNTLRRRAAWTLTLGLSVAVLSCSDDESEGRDGLLDAGIDAGMTADDRDDAGGFPCTSWTPPQGIICGGTHCQERLEDITGAASASGACQKQEEAIGFCQLTATNVVSACTLNNLDKSPDVRRACAQAGLSPKGYTNACTECFFKSAECALEKCISKCIDPNTPECDQCRVNQGCAQVFYDCAGYRDPIPR